MAYGAPHLEARLTFVSTACGGRVTPALSGYRGQFCYDGHDWDATWLFEAESVSPGAEITARVVLLSPDLHRGRLAAGKAIEVREGRKVVATGTITRILRPLEYLTLVNRVVPASGRGQDRLLTMQQGSATLIVIADGAGGTGGGAAAAEFVIGRLRDVFAGTRTPMDVSIWMETLVEVDRQLEAIGQTTVVVIVNENRRIIGASIGDSGAWRISPRAGYTDLTKGQLRKPLLGTGAARPVAFAVDVSDHTLLVATDGLLKYAPAERLRELALMEPLDDAADALIAGVRLKSGNLQDDVAVVVARAT